MKSFLFGFKTRILTILVIALMLTTQETFAVDLNPIGKTADIAARKSQQNLIGTITAIDAASGKITVKSDDGTSVTFATNEKTVFRRAAPGQTSIASAEKITLAELKIGDRVLVPGGVADAQTSVRQVVAMAGEAIAAKREKERGDWQTRGINGRIVALNAEKKEITVQARGRNGADALTVTAGNAKILRYAPDSLRSVDARPASFADLRVGDQIRVLGNRAGDGAIVVAEEIVSGSVTRAFGTITGIKAAAGEITIKNNQTGQTFTVVVGKKSVLKRLPAEAAQNLAQRRERRERRRQQREESTGAQTENQRDRGERRRENAEQGGTARGGSLQQMLENQPIISISELKAGETVLVTGTSEADPTRLTAVNLIAGEAEAMQLLQRPQNGRRNRNMSPGLPGNAGGGNAPATDDEP